MNNKNSAMACVAINKKGQVLLLKRSPVKKLSPNKWFVVGAFPLSEEENFIKWAHNELKEETGEDGKILKIGPTLEKVIDGRKIKIHSFLAKRNLGKVILNNEHTDYKWVDLDELEKYDLVNGTKEMIHVLIINE